MSDDPTTPPRALIVGGIRTAWRTTKSVYYADTWSWRALKSGALVFLGFCLWAAANVVLSYRPGWTVLRYVMAYGFLLALYGPVHHAVVIPLSFRLRRRAGALSRVGRRLPTAMLVVFLVAVLVLGTFPAGPMTIDFQSALSDASGDVNPRLHCVSGNETGAQAVHCHLDESEGVGLVVVTSGGRELVVDDDPPFEWTVEVSEMAAVRGERQFTVEVREESGALARQYTRRLRQIDGERVV